MVSVTSVFDDYENHIKRYSNLHVSMEELDEDEPLQEIVNKIISNNQLRTTAFNTYPEFIYACKEHINNDGEFTGIKNFIHAPSPMASFLTCLIMCRYH